jgi:hypothetical protein
MTDLGREALRTWTAEPVTAPPQLRDEMMLKVFAGADPWPMMPARRDWHEAKLAELEGLLALVREADGPEGPGRTLVAGIAYHRKMLEVLENLAAAAHEVGPGGSNPR